MTTLPAGLSASQSARPSFSAHLDAVIASGRPALTVSQYVDGLHGRIPLPERPVLITVDDGFADFAEHALPALASGFRAPSRTGGDTVT